MKSPFVAILMRPSGLSFFGIRPHLQYDESSYELYCHLTFVYLYALAGTSCNPAGKDKIEARM